MFFFKSMTMMVVYPAYALAFAWLKCEKDEIEDLESFLKEKKMIVRGGSRFGAETRYVRISMLDHDEIFNLLVERLAAMS